MRSWPFILLAMLAFGSGVYFLRVNNQEVIELTNKTIAIDADESTTPEQLEAALVELRNYIDTHLNSSVVFELTGSYERAYNEAVRKSTPTASDAFYEEAESSCDRQGQLTTDNAQCVIQYLLENGAISGGPADIQPPDRAQYSVARNSPIWTLDNAGLSFLVMFSLLIIAIIVGILRAVLKTRAHAKITKPQPTIAEVPATPIATATPTAAATPKEQTPTMAIPPARTPEPAVSAADMAASVLADAEEQDPEDDGVAV